MNMAVYTNGMKLWNILQQPACKAFVRGGWHLPTSGEWNILIDFLGGDSIAGGKMKETGTTHWNSPNTGATNESGFTALPAAIRNHPYR